jgi:hypothetical protein
VFRQILGHDRGRNTGFANLPSSDKPGVTMVALIGSSMLKPEARLPKPCQLSSRGSPSLRREPMPSSAKSSGPQTWNHQSLPHS